MGGKDMGLVVGLVAGLLLMVVLPASYRIWTMCGHRVQEPRGTVMEVIKRASEESGVKLLHTPLEKWTEADVKAAPDIYAWLGEMSAKVMPWEWSAEAVRKDPAGYAAAFADVFAGLRRYHDKALSSVLDRIDDVSDKAEVERTMCKHAEGELAKFASLSNSYPQTVVQETLSKGRFWGWNRKSAPVVVDSAAKRLEIEASLRAEIRARRGGMSALAAQRRVLEENAAAHRRVIAEIDDCVVRRVSAMRADPAIASSPENVRETELCIVRAIMAVAR